MKPKLISLALFAAVTVCGCSSVSVKTDYDHSAAFGQFHTYTLKPPERGLTLSPSVDAALRAALRENLATRGIREVATNERPQLAVVPHAFTQEKVWVQQYNNWGYGGRMWPYSYGAYGMWSIVPAYSVDTYTEGMLQLDFVDTSTQKLAFRGEAQGIMGSSVEKNTEKVEEAVKKIVANFPAGMGQYAVK